MRLLEEMTQRRGLSVAALLRQLVREEADRMGLTGTGWSTAAERLRSYYESDPEVAEWESADLGEGERGP